MILHTNGVSRSSSRRCSNEGIVASNGRSSTLFPARRSIDGSGIDRGKMPRGDSASNRDFRLILQTRRYACVIDCPRDAEREREELDGASEKEREENEVRGGEETDVE